MNEISKIFESFYTDFLLRDLFAKIIPGFIVLATTFYCIFGVKLLSSDTFEKAEWIIFLLIGGVCWILGFGIQCLGELICLTKQSPPNYEDSYRRYDLRIFFDRKSSDREKKQVERYAIVKESTGNLATALILSFIIFLVVQCFGRSSGGDGFNQVIITKDFILWAIGSIIIISALFLSLASNSHAKKQYEFMESYLNVKSNIRVVIFDFDGVIVNSMHSQEKAWKKAITDTKEVTNEQENRLLENFWAGKAGDSIFDDIKIEDTVVKNIRSKKDSNWNAEKSNISLFHDAREALRTLRPYFELAIASTSQSSYIHQHLDKNNLSELFSKIVTYEDVINSKPNPEMLQLIADKLGCPNKSMLMVGDTKNDQKMANAANVNFVFFQGDGRTNETTEQPKVTNWKELEKYIKLFKTKPNNRSKCKNFLYFIFGIFVTLVGVCLYSKFGA